MVTNVSVSRSKPAGVSRRGLLRYGGLLAGGAAASLLAACGGGESAPATTASSATTQTSGGAATKAPGTAASTTAAAAATPAAAGNPVQGGTIILGYDEPPTMDPRVSGSAKATNLMLNLFDTLITLDREKNELHPGLATSWEATPDGKSYTFRLASGVKFHDGTAFDAGAVKYTFDTIVDPTLKSLTAIGYLGPYDSTTAIDSHTVQVQFKDAYAPFLTNAAATVLAAVSPTAAQKSGPDAFGRNPVGTGPFMFKEWKEKISMTLARNPNYNWPVGIYQHKGPAYLDEIVAKFIPEASTRDGSLGTGETNIIDGVLPQNVSKYQADPKLQVLLPSVPGVPQILPINAAKSPTDDLNVRKAILFAVDTESLVKTLWFGAVKTAKAPLASSTWAYNPKVEGMYAFDANKAAQLLDGAGWKKGSGGVREKDGQQLTLDYITTSGIDGRAGELVQAYLSDVGFKVNLQQLEYAATAGLYLAGKHNIARIGYTGTDPVALTTLFHSKNIQGTNFNRTMKPDPKLDKMLDDATAEMDRDKRAQMYMDIQQYIMEQALFIPLWEQTVLWGASSKIKGLRPQSLGQIGFYDAWISA